MMLLVELFGTLIISEDTFNTVVEHHKSSLESVTNTLNIKKKLHTSPIAEKVFC